MGTIILHGGDKALKEELAGVLPKGYRIARKSAQEADWAITFVDIDEGGAAAVGRLPERSLAVAVTRQRAAGPSIEATALGAYDILQRPLKREAVQRIVSELEAFRTEIQETLALAHMPPTPTCAIVGGSRAIIDVCKQLARLSQSEAPVLITGETGTGKELIAESIAQMSSRFGKPFVVVNCAAVPEQLLESELFGYERGAFTGAVGAKEGMLKVADGGCVFFDEVGELPLPLQGKLLRFLQTQTFYPIGGTREVQVNVRVISATNRDLAAMVRERRFREDLYYRLKVTSIHIPPLRERKKDIRPLVEFFLHRYRHTLTRPVEGYTKAFIKEIEERDWPGNIRELENAVRSAIALSRTAYLTTHELRGAGSAPVRVSAEADPADALAGVLVPYLADLISRGERGLYDKAHAMVDNILLSAVLRHTGDNHSEAARLLGINRLTLRKKLGGP